MNLYAQNSQLSHNSRYDNPCLLSKKQTPPIKFNSASLQNVFQTQLHPHYKLNDSHHIHSAHIDSKTIYNQSTAEMSNLRLNYRRPDFDSDGYRRTFDAFNRSKKNSAKSQSSAHSRRSKDRMNYLQFNRDSKAMNEEEVKVRRLQRDLSGYHREFGMRVKEISFLRKKAKIAKISRMESSLNKKTNEFYKLKAALDDLQDDLAENEYNIQQDESRFEFHKDIAVQATEQLRITTKLLNDSEEKREFLEKLTGRLERKIRMKDAETKQLRNQLKELNVLINKESKENEELERIGYEKESYELREEDNARTIKSLKEQNDELSNEISKSEKKQSEDIERLVKHEKERVKLLEKAKEPPVAYREKEKKIAELLEEINQCIEDNKQQNVKGEEQMSMPNKELQQLKQNTEDYTRIIDELNKDSEILIRRIVELKQKRKRLEEEALEKQSPVVILEMNEINFHEAVSIKDKAEYEDDEEMHFTSENRIKLSSESNKRT